MDEYLKVVKDFRYVQVNNTIYLRLKDVADAIREMASTEATDVNNRLTEFADNLERKLNPCDQDNR